MSRRSEENLRGIPMKPYDLLREGAIVLFVVTVISVLFASLIPAPDYPQVRGVDAATRQPVAYLHTATRMLGGESEVQTYGPPYTNDYDDAQRALGLSPANWFGVTTPIDARVDMALDPLRRAAVVDPALVPPLRQFESASRRQQHAWASAYGEALERASVHDGRVRVPPGDYGPVPALMDGMLRLGRAGLLEGALKAGSRTPYQIDFTRPLLFFQESVDHSVAHHLNMLGEQWGISHETGFFPGAWWLWAYTFWYQIPPMSGSPNGDLQVVLIVLLLYAILLFIPFIPGLNSLPWRLGVYRIIWRDWYRREAPAADPPAPAPARAAVRSAAK